MNYNIYLDTIEILIGKHILKSSYKFYQNSLHANFTWYSMRGNWY